MFSKRKKRVEKNKSSQAVNLITVSNPKSPISEKYRTLRTNLKFASIGKQLQSLVVTSSGPSEGKSTTSSNLASVFAQGDMRVILIDADMRKPVLAKSFNLKNETGLSVYLSDESVHISEIIQSSKLVDGLDIITSGPIAPNPSELLQSDRMNELLDTLKQYYDLIIFDMPPLLAVTDAQIVSTKVDGTLLVVREGQAIKQNIKRSVELLQQVGANLLGVVYNAFETESSDNYYYYYGNRK